MKIKSALATQMSGSIGGLTGSHNKSGLYLRARSIPTNPRTDLQQVIRNATGFLANAWLSSLSQPARDQWSTYAANVPVKNKLGDSINLSGINMFVRCNVPRIQAGLSVIDVAPPIFTLGESVEGTLAQSDTDPFPVALTFSTPSTAGDMVLLYLAKPQNQTINYFKGPYQYQSATAATAGTITLSMPPGVEQGQKLFIRTRVAYGDGRLSGPADFSVVLADTPS